MGEIRRVDEYGCVMYNRLDNYIQSEKDMSDQKKISRRDAIKLISAATGASVLANLPSKWSKPELISAALPAYAQTSCVTVTITANGEDVGYLLQKFQGPSTDEGTLNLNQVYGPVNALGGHPFVWSCGSGCLELQLGGENGYSWEVVISTPGGNTPLEFSASSGISDLLVNLETGDYSTEAGNNTVGGCGWAHD